MPDEVRIWQVEKNDSLTAIARSPLDLEKRIEKWIVSNISVLSPDLLSREVRRRRTLSVFQADCSPILPSYE